MNRLAKTFADLHVSGRKTVMPYITGGYPDAETTVAILKRIDPRGCACVEVGIPFSDPIADGPVIQTSFSRALERGFKLDQLLAAVASHRDAIRVPLLAMVSYTVVYRRDSRAFVRAIRTAGFDGLIVPDLALEEADELAAIARADDCCLVMMVAPTTEAARRERITTLSEPFIYYQSLAGVTGERTALPPDLAAHVTELRRTTGKPICVGFGISTPQHVQAVCSVADGAIVGSAIVRHMNAGVDQGLGPEALADNVAQFIQELTTALPPC